MQKIKGRDVLGFADVQNPEITTLTREYKTADKVTLVLSQGESSERPRDIVHAALLLEDGRYDEHKLANWLEKFGDERDVLHQLSKPLIIPSSAWTTKIDTSCQRYNLSITAEDCYSRVGTLLERLFGRNQNNR